MQFKDVVTDPAQFRELIGEPPPPCVAMDLATPYGTGHAEPLLPDRPLL